METSPIAPPTAEELRRLSLVRHLYGLGIEQSHGSEPTAGLSILPFHDAAEAFLQLASERYGAGENKSDFMHYWTLLSDKGITLPNRETMRRLNAARRGLKHGGILPAHVELEGFRAAVTNFIYDGTALLFGISLQEISMVNLIQDESSRAHLVEAKEAYKHQDHSTALASAAKAFILVQHAYHAKLQASLPDWSLNSSLKARATTSTPSLSLGRGTDGTTRSAIEQIVKKLSENDQKLARVLSEAIEIIGYGLSLKEFTFFKAHTPTTFEMASGNFVTQWMKTPTEDGDVVCRCLDFVVDAAVRLGV